MCRWRGEQVSGSLPVHQVLQEYRFCRRLNSMLPLSSSSLSPANRTSIRTTAYPNTDANPVQGACDLKPDQNRHTESTWLRKHAISNQIRIQPLNPPSFVSTQSQTRSEPQTTQSGLRVLRVTVGAASVSRTPVVRRAVTRQNPE